MRRMRKELLNRYSSMGEPFVDVDDQKTEGLDKLLDIGRELGSGEFKKNTLIIRERNKLIKKIQEPGWKL